MDYFKLSNYVEVSVGDRTISSNGWAATSINVPTGKKALYALATGWTSNTGAFSLMPYDNTCYIVGTSGVQVKGLKIRLYYY